MISTKFFLTFLLIFTVIIFGTGYWFVSNFKDRTTPQLVGINEITTSGSTSLEASPAPTKQTIGQEFTLDINAHSGTDAITSVKLEMVYDQSKLEVKSLTKTDYLPIEIDAPVIMNGRIQANYGVASDSAGKADWGTIAKITIKPLALGEHTIEFNDGTIVTSSDFPTNALRNVTPIEIAVYNVGDIDKNGGVYLTDYNLFVGEFGKSGYSPADLDGSGQVNLNDYKLFVANYGKKNP